LNLNSLWYRRHPLRWLLFPAACVFQISAYARRLYLTTFRQRHFPVPVIVVGNLSVGGVGKTPLVIALVKHFQARGLRVGVVSKGYGASIRHFPHAIGVNDTADDVGDEPFLIAKKTAVPVVIAKKRTEAVQYLLDHYDTQLIISDDGLQHYRMGRAIEIVVIDGLRGLGNGYCLPAGPLREGPSRLKRADFVVVNAGAWPGAFQMNLVPGQLFSVLHEQPVPWGHLKLPVAAVAGIGHPQRFFDTLTACQLTHRPYVFPDHYRFKVSDFSQMEQTVVMTEKDAVKCQGFATESMYFLPVEAKLSDEFWSLLCAHQQLKDYLC
jgi:tetraacyldisaccharide 4'-kinase